MAQGYTLVDSSLYYAIQSSGFGVPATVMKGALGVTSYEVTPSKDSVEGVAMLGAGIWRSQDIPTGVTVAWRISGWGSITHLASLIAWAGQMIKGSSSAAGTTGFSHPHTANTKNSTKKYATLAIVENETSAGVGLVKEFLRDSVAATLNVNIVSKQAFTFEISGSSINAGPGAASGISYSFNNTLHVPNISNPANALTYPAAFPAGFCSTQLNLAYAADLSYGPNCIGSVEASDILIDNARWTVNGSGIADTNFASFYKSVNYGTTSPAANTSALSAIMPTGALTIALVSDDIIASSSPPTPFGITFYFPDMQYTSARFTGERPRMGEWTGKSYGSAMTMTPVNDLSSASMAI